MYHPIYHGPATKSASRLPRATVIHDFSKAFALPALRTGWIIERDPERRKHYWNARAYFSISNNPTAEMLAEIAMRKRDVVLGKTQEVADQNLQHLERFMAEHRETLGWIRPQGGPTAFPWLVSAEDARPFCEAAAEQGVLLVPGDCFDAPSHFRIGFVAAEQKFPAALDRLSEVVKNWQPRSQMVSAF
ncbi:aminotransferase class I/II-fold pyridoxal phosphate-dependent enzyme [Granulicella arctica]|uniref:Aspartate/methionine/tyrosine aminotransferase n=1 Tax=Granulicella arctica TaxID=940613 RepID=A0A7Y9PF08_9BACT|nr:aspartate/methionine/tyrosine aminotransferase [Granulicella arctica]